MRSPQSGVKHTSPFKSRSKLAAEDYTKQFGLPDALHLNARVIEAWINNILKDAELLDIPNEIRTGDSLKPL